MKVLEVDFTDRDLVERYDTLFEECPGAFIQQSTYWGNVIKDLGPDQPIFLICHDGEKDVAGLPLYLYEHELGNILTSVPQPGPLGGIFYRESVSEEQRDVIYKCLLAQAIKVAKEYECIALTIITNPFVNDVALYEKYLQPSFVFENFTQFIPLADVFEGSNIVLHNWKRRSNLNRNVKGAKELGYITQVYENHDQLGFWYEVHEQRCSELGIMPIDYRLFDNASKELMPRGKAWLVLVLRGRAIIAGGFHICHHKVVDAFMLSMNSEYSKPSPMYVCVEKALGQSNGTGAEIYNWQSSQSRESGVYSFKKQWDSLDRPYYFVTKLFCSPQRIQAIGLGNLKAQYYNHFVVPFGVFEKGFDVTYFKKGE